MLRYIIPFCILLAGCSSYKQIHQNALVVDTHNDILTAAFEGNYRLDDDLVGKTHSDLQRFAKAGIDVQIFSVWCDGKKMDPFRYANEQIDTLMATIQRNPGRVMLVNSSSDIADAQRSGKLAAMIGVEGGHMIEGRMDFLKILYDRGVRYLTLTWNNSTSWASSALDENMRADSLQHKGLTEFGKNVVREMNRLGMIVDVSHVGEKTFWDAMAITTKPVIASHSNAWALAPVFRNLKDEQIKAIAKNGGVIHLNFYSGFVDAAFENRSRAFKERHRAEVDSLRRINPEPYYSEEVLFKLYPDEVGALRPPLSMLIDHLDHIVKIAGVDHVGLGSDFDGVSSLPIGLNDVTDMQAITRELARRGYSKTDIKKILGENFMRVLRANEAASRSIN